jgi:hypothetical protein
MARMVVLLGNHLPSQRRVDGPHVTEVSRVHPECLAVTASDSGVYARR